MLELKKKARQRRVSFADHVLTPASMPAVTETDLHSASVQSKLLSVKPKAKRTRAPAKSKAKSVDEQENDEK